MRFRSTNPGLVSLLICVCFYHSKKLISCRRRSSGVPEAAGAWPAIGHLHLFGRKELTYRILSSLADKYGPAFTLKLGSHKALVVSDWEMTKECLTIHDKAFATRPSLSASKLLGYDYAMFDFAPYGNYWREMRKVATIELLSNHRLDMFKHIRASEWFADLTHNKAFGIVGKRLYGSNADCDEGEAGRCQKLTSDFFYLFGVSVLSDAIPFLGWLDIGGYKKAMRKTARELDTFVHTWLDEHKQKRLLGGV
ncbi:hypothetical protein PTKIN_Ptkin08bG0173300 [Pterospermum kingtungense]